MKHLAIALALILSMGACAPPRSVERPAATVIVEGQGLSPAYGIVGWSGTGWYIAGNDSASVVLTAGHVCLGAEDLSLAFYTAGGVRDAFVVHDDDDDDLCLLLVDGPAPAILPLSPRPARAASDDWPGDVVRYRGYPGGVLGEYDGLVVGVGDDGELHVSVDGFYGASGSAIVLDGRVVGVLVRGHMGLGPAGSVYATGLDALRDARDVALRVLRDLGTAPIATVRGAVYGSVTGHR